MPLPERFLEREVNRSHLFVVRRTVVLCKVVRKVEYACLPVYFELLLCFTVLEPIEAYVHCFHALRLYRAVDDAVGC